MTARDVIAENLAATILAVIEREGLCDPDWADTPKVARVIASTLAQPSGEAVAWEVRNDHRGIHGVQTREPNLTEPGWTKRPLIYGDTTPPAPLGGLTEGEVAPMMVRRLAAHSVYGSESAMDELEAIIRQASKYTAIRLTAPRAEGVGVVPATRICESWRKRAETCEAVSIAAASDSARQESLRRAELLRACADEIEDACKLPADARVGTTTFRKGVGADMVVRAAIRAHSDAALTAAAPKVAAPQAEAGEVEAEAAYWRFDARHKGNAEWASAPMSERDAFKAEYRALLARLERCETERDDQAESFARKLAGYAQPAARAESVPDSVCEMAIRDARAAANDPDTSGSMGTLLHGLANIIHKMQQALTAAAPKAAGKPEAGELAADMLRDCVNIFGLARSEGHHIGGTYTDEAMLAEADRLAALHPAPASGGVEKLLALVQNAYANSDFLAGVAWPESQERHEAAFEELRQGIRAHQAPAPVVAQPAAQGGDGDADMFWDDDDPERAENSIDDVVIARVERGGKPGEIFQIQQAVRLPNITVEILLVSGNPEDDDEEYGWREVPAALAPQRSENGNG